MLDVWVGGAPLSLLSPVGDLRWSTNEHGSLAASWSMNLPRGYAHPLLRQGRPVEVRAGGVTVWGGVLAEPDRTTWSFVADGYHRLAARFLAETVGGAASTVIDTAVDAAIARGLPWTRPTSIDTVALSTIAQDDAWGMKLSALLDAWCEMSGQTWHVDPWGALRVVDDPTQPRWHLDPSIPAMATADDDYSSRLVARYVAAVSGASAEPSAYALTSAQRPPSATRWGAAEDFLDLESLGLLTEAAADAAVEAALRADRTRPAFTQGVDLSPMEITTPGGVVPHPWQVVSGAMVKHLGALDRDGAGVLGGMLTWIIGSTEYAVADRRLTLAPRGLLARTSTQVAAEVAATKVMRPLLRNGA
ncbi:hypothetical protein [Nocardioides bruguierae]|uniref:hypothetical protein n=1 Tax=Nocardioides bruguierae TaxID=2945102 RepID=UPI002021F649|nr:hypothetical protein [Nocardioides bruguierae]MCL8026306.1 hypothetical protein [Nocardioides bruguierae]